MFRRSLTAAKPDCARPSNQKNSRGCPSHSKSQRLVTGPRYARICRGGIGLRGGADAIISALAQCAEGGDCNHRLPRISVFHDVVNKGKRRETSEALEDPPLSHSLVPFGLGGGLAAR